MVSAMATIGHVTAEQKRRLEKLARASAEITGQRRGIGVVTAEAALSNEEAYLAKLRALWGKEEAEAR
jgi:hypothetical protein